MRCCVSAERVAYGDDPSQFVEVSRGSGAGTVVLLHGGFWRARVGLDHIAPVAADLHDRGHTVWNVEYRRVGQAGWPATLDDVAAAVGLVGAPCVVVGHSAGGHLATWVASRVPVAGVVSLAGVLTLADAAREGVGGTAVPDLVGGMPDAVPERYAAASPAARLPLGVPALLTHGGKDDIVPPAMSEEFARATDCDLVVLPDEDHYGHLDPANPLWRAVVEWL